MRVSILINNYNYEPYLARAIESALEQIYENVEVVVVDDGSTDGSADIIRSFGNRIIPVLKENGGQASAMNAGFAASSGEVVIFLDADDVILSDTAKKMAGVFSSNERVVKAQYRLRIVDAKEEATGGIYPSIRVAQPSGDITDLVAKCRTYLHPPTSGNAFRRTAIEPLMPIDKSIYLWTPTGYLVYNVVLFGEIVSFDEVGGLYRMHGKGVSEKADHDDADELLSHLEEETQHRRKQMEIFRQIKGKVIRQVGLGDLTHIKNRVIFNLLYPNRYPYNDKLAGLCIKGVIASFRYPFVPKSRDRLFWASWFVAVLLLPRAIGRNLAIQIKNPKMRLSLLGRILGDRDRRHTV